MTTSKSCSVYFNEYLFYCIQNFIHRKVKKFSFCVIFFLIWKHLQALLRDLLSHSQWYLANHGSMLDLIQLRPTNAELSYTQWCLENHTEVQYGLLCMLGMILRPSPKSSMWFSFNISTKCSLCTSYGIFLFWA